MENQHSSAPPDVQLLCGLHKTGLIRLLQHLLRVTHEPAVLQHALVLLHLQDIVNTRQLKGENFQPAQTLNEDTRVSFLSVWSRSVPTCPLSCSTRRFRDCSMERSISDFLSCRVSNRRSKCSVAQRSADWPFSCREKMHLCTFMHRAFFHFSEQHPHRKKLRGQTQTCRRDTRIVCILRCAGRHTSSALRQ